MERLLVLIFSLTLGLAALSQVPTNCFEIESLLVDACAEGQSCGDAGDDACQCEGKNEMFRFIIGPNDLNTADMNVDWPNGFNQWQGVCQDATTANVVQELNNTIINCGLLVEPTGGVLPAGRKILMVNSTDMCETSNSFAGLSDTLIIIFQCPGNWQGHFANYNDNGNNLRTIEVDFGPGCYDEVTYDRSELVDQAGVNQAQDGARVDFTWDGDDTYANDGCSAPIDQVIYNAGPDVSLCPGDVVNLNPEFSDSFTDVTWSGGQGVFDVDALAVGTYTPSADDPVDLVLTLSATGCNGVVTDEIDVSNLSSPLTGITSSLGDSICEGEETILTAQGTATLYEWSTNVFAPQITVTTAGVYDVTATNACGTESLDIEISLFDPPSIDLIEIGPIDLCDGEELLLNANSSEAEINWSTNEIGPQITVTGPDWYYASAANQCGLASDSVEVVELQTPVVSISPEGPISLCDGDDAELTASGDINDTYLWSTGESEHVITVSDVDVYSVTATNDCGTDIDSVEVIQGGYSPIADITYPDDLLICTGESITLTGSGDGAYSWENGASMDLSFEATETGVYTLLVVNECGNDEATVTISADESPEVQLNGSSVLTICNGESASVTVSGNPPFTWSDGGLADTNSFTEAGSYYVSSTAACGTDTVFFNIITEGVIAQPTATPAQGESPLEVEFLSEQADDATSEWTFEDGSSVFGEEAFYTFIESGLHEVVLDLTSADGCTNQASVFVSVGACTFSLYVPNAFTPNNDQVNDQLRVEGACIESFEWHIFDRWGREVYYSTDRSKFWNGADVSGYAVTDGEYAYWVQITDGSGEVHRFVGSITVLR